MELTKAKLKLYSRLAQAKYRRRYGLFMAQGTKCVLETLPFFKVEAIFATHEWLEIHGADVSHFPVCKIGMSDMSRLTTLSDTPPVVAVYTMPEAGTPDMDELSDSLTIVLDGIQDPGNLGTIIRTADWFGVKNIIASHETADIYNPKTVQATMGSIGRVKVVYADLHDFVDRYRRETSNPVYGTLLEGDSIYSTTISPASLLVMGNEGRGISPDLRNMISNGLYIPPYPANADRVESLNVGIATGIALAEFRRKNG